MHTSDKKTMIRAGWFIDGAGGPIRRHATFRIQEGRIADGDAPRHADGGGLDFNDCTILPGLVDAHIHLSMSGTADPETRQWQLDADYAGTAPVISDHIRDLLAHGVVAVRDGGDHHGHVHRYRLDHGDACLLGIRTAGRAWRRKGRYGRLIGRFPAEGQSLGDAVSAETDAIDHVKIVNAGLNSLTEFGKESAPQFGAEELASAVRAASARGWPVMVHANGRKPVRMAVEAGCRSIEHGFFMGKDNLKRMADRGTFWVPTAGTMTAYAAILPQGGAESDGARRNAEAQLEQMAWARELGVRVALGTDAGSMGVFHGAGVIEEMRLLMSAGYSISEAIRCAAANGAELLNLPDVSVLMPGRAATFVVVDGPPSDLPDSLGRVRSVCINGRFLEGIGRTSEPPPA